MWLWFKRLFMKTGKAGKELIKSFEVEPGTGKPHLKAYLCPSGQWTVGEDS